MKLSADNEILEFAEKPKVIPEGYEKKGMCLTNTFQFSVSKEAFKALATLEPFFPAGKGKEPKDWSKTYVPILMSLTQKDDIELGYKTVFWSFAYADWDNCKQPSQEYAIKKILDNTHNGAIILLHPTSKTNADILPTLISEWRKMGYEFGLISEIY